MKFGCGYVFVVLLFVAFGVVSFVTGRALAPATNDAAQVFRNDPACSPNLAGTASSAACTTRDATVVTTEERSGGTSKSPSHTPYAYLRFEDGTTADVELDGSDGDTFADTVRAGSAARVQTFHGTVVRIVAGNVATETIDAPDVDASTVGQMTVVGPLAIVIGIAIATLRLVYLRRAGRPQAFPPRAA